MQLRLNEILLLKKIKKNSFIKNIMLIAGGTAFAQALGIIFSPIITRIYPPEQYGILTAYTAVLNLLVISASFDYQKAIPIAEDEDKAINLLVLSLSFLIGTTIIIIIALTMCGDYFLALLNSKILLSYKYLIPFGVFCSGIYNITLQWGFRARSYKVITRTKITQSIASNITKLLLGFMKFGPIGLILGDIIGKSSGITSLSLPIIKSRELLSKISFQKFKYVLKRYKNFPIYSAPSNYVYTLGNNMPALLLTSLFGNTVTGFFGLANSMINLPMNLIGTSVSQVFYSEMARLGKDNPKKIKNLAISLIKKLAIIALFPLIIFFLFGPFIFSIAFGNEWYEAGIYARILSIMVYFNFVILPAGRILEVFEKQREGLIFNIVRLGLVIFIFVASKVFELTSYQTIALYSISNSITYIALLILVMKIMNQKIKSNNLL